MRATDIAGSKAARGGYVSRALDSGLYGAYSEFPSHSDSAGVKATAKPADEVVDGSGTSASHCGYIERALRSGRFAPFDSWPSFTDSAV